MRWKYNIGITSRIPNFGITVRQGYNEGHTYSKRCWCFDMRLLMELSYELEEINVFTEADHTILLAIRNQSTMADALISVVVEQLAPFLLDKLKKEVKLVLGAPEAVQELHDTFDKIRDVLDDVEKRHVKNVLLNLEKNEIKKVPESAWLEKLKDVSYEMEDVLDEWCTKILK
ncbi:hypothetical protein GIB67_030636 [Kingdonia uniflora]|uniref:Disease resistance N-terminal domain-containing protein n=1 Tax=Kingdonia uniflora TaxID=39325 RepID=A0A7J7LI90_9MAGN|nr:hypothetical protein GIB67_030636 [Kingdonia uniflora]